MIHLSRPRTLAIELGESLAVSHIAFEDGTDFACLAVAEYPDGAALVEEEIHFFQ